MITLQQLQVFCTVADSLHFTRAAEALHLTQPAVTFHIRSLERELGLALVELDGRRVHLTSAGEYLRLQAMDLLNAANMIERHMSQFADVQQGTLKLGATLTIGNYLVPDLLASFHHAFPAIRLSLVVANTAQIERALLARELDLALVEWHITSPDIEVIPFQSDELVVAVSRGHPLASDKEVSVERIASEPFVLREPGSGTRALALESLGAFAQRIDVVLELDRAEAIKHAVMAGLGMTIISHTAIEEEVKRGDLVALRLTDKVMQRDFSIAYLRAHMHSPAVRALLQHMQIIYPRLKAIAW